LLRRDLAGAHKAGTLHIRYGHAGCKQSCRANHSKRKKDDHT
jgi:hypothetical protein